MAQAALDESARALQSRDRRRTDVVGIFPDDRALVRLASMLAIEANDEWLVGRAYMSRQSMGPLLEQRPHRTDGEEAVELTAA